MPNNVTNEVVFRNIDKEAVENILGKAMKDGDVDFTVLVPIPLNIWQGPLGKAEEEAFCGHGWYDWSVNNWGTKWNAYDTREPVFRKRKKTLAIVFDTAWVPPRLWLCALFNATQMPFQHNWFDEGDFKAHTEEYYFEPDAALGVFIPSWKESEASEELNRHMYRIRFKKVARRTYEQSKSN